MQARASKALHRDMVKITYRAADGTRESSTVSWAHMMLLVTDPNPKPHATTP
jgi:hypothetical protein